MQSDRLSAIMNPMRWPRGVTTTQDALIAVVALALGYVLLWVDAFSHLFGMADPTALVPPLVLASGSLLLRRTRPLLGLGLAATAAAADAAVGPSLLPVLILIDLLYNATL